MLVGSKIQGAHNHVFDLVLMDIGAVQEILYPLGLALIELSLGRPISDFHSPRTVTTDDLQAKLNEVYNESGWGYKDVVNSCLFCPHGIASLGFEDEKFEKHVLSTVISPLLRDLLIFEGHC
jgi:hypothetical protein